MENKNYSVTVNEVCPEHGGLNFAYQHEDESFARIESACEGCNVLTSHTPSEELQATRESRDHSRPSRPR